MFSAALHCAISVLAWKRSHEDLEVYDPIDHHHSIILPTESNGTISEVEIFAIETTCKLLCS